MVPGLLKLNCYLYLVEAFPEDSVDGSSEGLLSRTGFSQFNFLKPASSRTRFIKLLHLFIELVVSAETPRVYCCEREIASAGTLHRCCKRDSTQEENSTRYD
jgi:hypothetical protein